MNVTWWKLWRQNRIFSIKGTCFKCVPHSTCNEITNERELSQIPERMEKCLVCFLIPGTVANDKCYVCQVIANCAGYLSFSVYVVLRTALLAMSIVQRTQYNNVNSSPLAQVPKWNICTCLMLQFWVCYLDSRVARLMEIVVTKSMP
jgi:hypothetical protein